MEEEEEEEELEEDPEEGEEEEEGEEFSSMHLSIGSQRERALLEEDATDAAEGAWRLL